MSRIERHDAEIVTGENGGPGWSVRAPEDLILEPGDSMTFQTVLDRNYMPVSAYIIVERANFLRRRWTIWMARFRNAVH